MANELKPWKCGNEFLPYHPQASHCAPEYRAGWNDCYSEAQKQIAALEAKLADALHWKDLLDAKKALGARIVAEAIAAEREACAGYAENYDLGTYEGHQIAQAIRSRTPKETGADLSGAERKSNGME